MPPETIKDSLGKARSVPLIFIMPSIKFDIQAGVTLSELETPAFYNFFVHKKKITVVTDLKGAGVLKMVFQEALLGPANLDVDSKDNKRV
jgi:hypothetical protein